MKKVTYACGKFSPARAKSVRAAKSNRCFLPTAERPLRGAPLEAVALSCSRASVLQMTHISFFFLNVDFINNKVNK